MTDDLIERAVLRAEDLPWWLDRLEEDAAGGGDGGLSAEVVVRALAGLILDDEEALTTARKRCGSSPALASRVGAELAQDTVDRRRQWRTEAEQRRRARESEQASFRFSQQRLDDALLAGDLSAALEELERSPAPEDRPPGPDGPTSGWTTAARPAQQRIARLAADHLVAGHFNLDDYDDVHRLGLTISVAAAVGEDLADVPAGSWSRWLPGAASVFERASCAALPQAGAGPRRGRRRRRAGSAPCRPGRRPGVRRAAVGRRRPPARRA